MKKPMDFDAAKKKLAGIAKDEYHNISYEETTTRGELFEVCCCIYIHNEDRHNGRTWEEAFKNRLIALNPKPAPKSIKVGAVSKKKAGKT